MTITIQRTFMKGEITEGHVTIDGQRICDTLENSFSCLAAGSYAVELVKCKQYARKMILVKTFAPRCADCPRMRFVFGNTRMPQPCPQLKPGNGIHSPLKSIIFRWTDNHLIEKQGESFVKLVK